MDLLMKTGGHLARGSQLAELYLAYQRRDDVYQGGFRPSLRPTRAR